MPFDPGESGGATVLVRHVSQHRGHLSLLGGVCRKRTDVVSRALLSEAPPTHRSCCPVAAKPRPRALHFPADSKEGEFEFLVVPQKAEEIKTK